MRNTLITILLFLTTSFYGLAQSGWEYLLAYGRTVQVCEGKQAYYFASESGVFAYNKEDQSIDVYSKQNILSESVVSKIAFNSSSDLLVVGFDNGNIDLIPEDGDVYTITDVARKSIVGDKTLNNISCDEQYAYLAYAFGIVVLDTQRKEIKDTYIIGEGGSYLAINDISVFNNYIYAATDDGLLCASLDDPNLLDYSHWKHPEDEDLLLGKYKMVRTNGSEIYAFYTEGSWGTEICYYSTDGISWERTYKSAGFFKDFYPSSSFNAYTTGYITYISNKNHESIGSIKSYTINGETTDTISPQTVIISEDGTITIADYIYGGIMFANNNCSQIQPDGPVSNNSYEIEIEKSVVRVASGDRGEGYWQYYTKGEIKEYTESEGWSVHNYDTKDMMADNKFRQIVKLEVDKSDPNHFFASSHGRGIMEFQNGEVINFFYEGNSELQDAAGGSDYTFVSGLTFDDENNLWATNELVQNTLVKFTKGSGNTWDSESYYLPEIANNYRVTEIIYTTNNHLWMIVETSGSYAGLYVVSKDVSQKKSVLAKSYFSNGTEETITSLGTVHAIEEDQNGEIWIATEKGVAVFYQPQDVFNTSTMYASQPSEDKGDNYYNPLLTTQNVLSMYIDPANRKWFGTENSGLFLYSEDGTELIEHFTTENSSLISNTILSLDMDESNGELYIATTKGLVKYKTGSTAANAQFNDVYAYPNPVRETYEGDIYIRGLMQDTNVKITDISGRLVYETTSLGGQAVWNGCDLNGNRVYTGVYMVFCASENGEESAVTKILFIR